MTPETISLVVPVEINENDQVKIDPHLNKDGYNCDSRVGVVIYVSGGVVLADCVKCNHLASMIKSNVALV